MKRTFRIINEKYGRLIMTTEGTRTMYSLQDICQMVELDWKECLPLLKKRTVTCEVPDRGEHIFIGSQDAERILKTVKGHDSCCGWLSVIAFNFFN